MPQYILVWDTDKDVKKRSTGSFPVFRAGQASVGSGDTEVSVVFSEPVTDLNFSVIPVWQNTADPTPQMQPLIVTAFDVNGFTVKWNAPTDSANYKINWYTISHV